MHTHLRDSAPNAHIVTAAARGDEASWQRIVERYSSLLWAVTRAHRLNDSDAADVFQTTWLRLIEHLPNIKNPDGIGAWLATTARRECQQTLRRASRSQPSDELDVLVDQQVAGADARLLRHERDAALWDAFKRLPERDRALLRMLTADPTPSYDEIAAALGIAIGSIGPMRGRALERLRCELVTAEAAGVYGTGDVPG
jgi:RNA polymerase sigma factor (sigma-70 family)